MVQQVGEGVRLPPERDLAAKMGVARQTLRRALDDLESQGLLARRQGAGTFVNPQGWVKPLVLRSFSEDMRSRGLVPTSAILGVSTQRADAKVALKLRVAPGTPVYEIRRLRLANGEPMAIEWVCLLQHRLPGFDPAVLAKQSLYEVLEREYGIQIRNAAQEIGATVVTEQEADLLDVAPFSPALLVERQVMAIDGEPIEYGKTLYRADRYRFEVSVGRAAPEDGAAR